MFMPKLAKVHCTHCTTSSPVGHEYLSHYELKLFSDSVECGGPGADTGIQFRFRSIPPVSFLSLHNICLRKSDVAICMALIASESVCLYVCISVCSSV